MLTTLSATPAEVDGWPHPKTRPMLQQIDTLEETIRWIVAHDAEIVEKWKQQHRFNDNVERLHVTCADQITSQGSRITAIEKKLIIVASAAAAGGGVLGNALMSLFGS